MWQLQNVSIARDSGLNPISSRMQTYSVGLLVPWMPAADTSRKFCRSAESTPSAATVPGSTLPLLSVRAPEPPGSSRDWMRLRHTSTVTAQCCGSRSSPVKSVLLRLPTAVGSGGSAASSSSLPKYSSSNFAPIAYTHTHACMRTLIAVHAALLCGSGLVLAIICSGSALTFVPNTQHC